MVPICMVTEETLSRVPEDVLRYLRALRRRIIEGPVRNLVSGSGEGYIPYSISLTEIEAWKRN
jgi:hypothetical protein